MHLELFATLHKQHVNLKDANAIFDWAAGKGIDRKKFTDTFNSFGVNGKTQRSIELTRKFDIPGTPALVIDGKFIASPSMTMKSERVIDYDRYFEVVDALIAESRKGKGK
jgi:thiol:disulfide interchange protein DsbA